jgi:hypothetical protein
MKMKKKKREKQKYIIKKRIIESVFMRLFHLMSQQLVLLNRLSWCR